MTMITHDIEGLDDIRVLEGRAHTKLSSHLFVVLLLRFARAAWTELFDCVDDAAVFGLALDKPDSASGSRAECSTEFTVLFCNGGMGCVRERCKWTVHGGVRVRVAAQGREGGVRVVG